MRKTLWKLELISVCECERERDARLSDNSGSGCEVECDGRTNIVAIHQVS